MKRLHTTQDAVFSIPTKSVLHQLRQWGEMHQRKRAQHPFQVTMHQLSQEWQRREDRVVIQVRATSRLRDFDDRFTEAIIDTDPSRWKHLPDPGKDMLRQLARGHRSAPQARIEIPTGLEGIAVHDPEKERLLEGAGATLWNKLADSRRWGIAKAKYPILSCMTTGHPYTLEAVRDHKRSIFFRRAWLDSLPIGTNLVRCNLGHAECPCDDILVETMEHLFLWCPLYKKQRLIALEGSEGTTSRADQSKALMTALGLMHENPKRPNGDMAYRKRQTRRALDAAWSIWAKRCKIWKERRRYERDSDNSERSHSDQDSSSGDG